MRVSVTHHTCRAAWRVTVPARFELQSIDASTHSVKFATAESHGWTHPKGGWQGGRGWQIRNASSINDTMATDYLVGGKWMVENFFEALDVTPAPVTCGRGTQVVTKN